MVLEEALLEEVLLEVVEVPAVEAVVVAEEDSVAAAEVRLGRI